MPDLITPEQVIDLTAPSNSLRYVEILTPGGIVRVNVGLENVRSRRPVVVVEVEPNTLHQRKTAPGGDWAVEAEERCLGSRFDVTLTREADNA
jgi:hypothetical protein